jgi:RNA polymerase sigma factor (sigma-70 family)
MATSPISVVLQRLRTTFVQDGSGMTDGELLTLFLDSRDEAPLAALVRRHASMVWGVCRRLLRSHHDAEDAFQATVLVLVRKADSVKPREAVGNWLYGVAHQTAVRVRAMAAKRGGRERQVVDLPEPIVPEASSDDLLSLLDQELSRLPDKHRLVIVLGDLEGKTRTELARQLGVSEGTVAGRLARAREMLARRLARRGLAMSGGPLAAALAQNAASASAPAPLVASTIQAASQMAAGQVVSVGLI